MKKTKVILALCISTFLGFMQGNSQNQQLAIPPHNYNLSGVSAVTNIANAPTASTISNGAYDANGNLLFYIIGTSVYTPASASSLGSLPNTIQTGGAATSLQIVPVPGQENCNKFYVIYENGCGLCYVTITYNSPGNISSSPALNTVYPNNSDSHILIPYSPYKLGSLSPTVISKLTTSNQRYLFVLAWGATTSQSGVYRFTIGGTSVGIDINSMTQIASNSDLQNAASQGVGFFDSGMLPTNQLSYQLSLSPDQTRLGWGGGIVEGFNNNIYTYSNQYVYEIKLTSSYGLQASSYQYYLLNSGLPASSLFDEVVAGFTYDAAGHMYASTQSGIYYSTGYGNAFNIITGSSAFTYNSSNTIVGSQLQYMLTNNLVIGVNPSSTNGVGKFFTMNNGQITNSNYFGGSTTGCTIGYGGIRFVSEFYLPQQVNGDAIVYSSLTPVFSIITSPLCANSPIVINTSYNATGNITPTTYYWQVDQCLSNGHNPIFVSSGTSTTSFGSSFTIPGSNTLTCGNYYKITYGVSNTAACVPEVATAAIIYINCNPTPLITGNTNICYGNSTQLCVSPSGSPYTIGWTLPGGHKLLGSSPCLTESPTVNTTYNVTLTNTTTGCSGTASQLVTVQDIRPNLSLAAVGIANQTYYTIEASNYTYLSSSQDPSFGLYWEVSETPYGSSSPYPLVPNSDVKNSSCWWTHGAPVWFAGYMANTPGIYPNTNATLVCNAQYATLPVGEGYFQKGHEYLITFGTWSNTCPWNSTANIAYVCSGCRFESEITPVPSNLTFEEAMSIKTRSAESLSSSSTVVDIYPNPNNGNFTIETQATTPQLVEMFDLTGRLVLSQTINGIANINVSDLTNGIYNIKISGNNTLVNKRVVISK